MRIAIVGAGFSGVAAAIALRRAGHADVVLYERADDLGGVWRANTYPGAACDVLSYLYSFSYAQRTDWSRPCSPQAEILDYLRDTAQAEGITDAIRFGTEIADARFDEARAVWRMQATDGSDLPECDALVIACGQLSRPTWPSIEGMETFAGASFHSAEWDHDVPLAGKRVAVIGTGASAIQFVPQIAPVAGHVDVFQRSPAWLLPRLNHRYRPRQRWLIEHVPGLQALRRANLVGFLEGGATALKSPATSVVLKAWSWLHMRRQVRSRAMWKKVKPDYPIGCKRILLTSYWLPTLQRDDVELVTEPIERVTPGGVVSGGREHPADVIVYGTGFAADKFVLPMTVRGRGGRELQQVWDGGARAHLGITVSGYPNLFLMYGPNTNLGFGSIIVMLEAQANYIVDALAKLRDSGAATMDVRQSAQDAWDADVQGALTGSVWTQCHSWYRVGHDGRVVNNWPGRMGEYEARVAEVDLADFELA